MKNTVKDIISVIIALIAIVLFGLAFVGCYLYAFKDGFSLYTLLAAAIGSLIPGLLCYGITAATIDFLQNDFSWRSNVNKATNSSGATVLKNIFTLLVALIAIVLFGGVVVVAFIFAFKHLAFASILAACLVSIIPGLICYSCILATAEFVKKEFFGKASK